MQRLSFRSRVSLTLFLLALPSAVALLGWAYSVLTNNPAKAAQVVVNPLRKSVKDLLTTIDTTKLTQPEKVALEAHRDRVSQALAISRRAEVYKSRLTTGLALFLAVVGSVLFFLAIVLGRNLTAQLSSPITELVGWAGNIQRGEALPDDPPRGGAPEFESLRTAMREMAAGLTQARCAELESERLRAFREVARRVAHEMKNPLTPIRFAVSSLAGTATKDQEEALEVLRAESVRLEQLARDFANLGRLPEGPPAEVDLGELLGELARTSLPAEIDAHLQIEPGTPHVTGHYDSLRRAFANVLRNAAEAMLGRGRLDVTIRPWQTGVRVSISDQGPGIEPAKRSRIFEPYFTDKADGTGLGLAIVKQAVDLHQGSIEVTETPGGGATFGIWLPLVPESARSRPPDRPFVERRLTERRRNWR
ncbi:MAG: HAMP domain-containing sensor histidine kinase [Gemmatimonadales bacterium]|nr:HAMP domain-containing sensor histidine kinase [Gemmatimonadales bacterium]